MMARVRTALDHWKVDDDEFIEWLTRKNALMGATPADLIQSGDYSPEAWLGGVVPAWLRVDA